MICATQWFTRRQIYFRAMHVIVAGKILNLERRRDERLRERL